MFLNLFRHISWPLQPEIFREPHAVPFEGVQHVWNCLSWESWILRSQEESSIMFHPINQQHTDPHRPTPTTLV